MCWSSGSLGDGALAADQLIVLRRCTAGWSQQLAHWLLQAIVPWPLISQFLWVVLLLCLLYL